MGQTDSGYPILAQQGWGTLNLLANIRGGVNNLMAEILEDHIRLHIMAPEKGAAPTHEVAEDLIDLVRAYLK